MKTKDAINIGNKVVLLIYWMITGYLAGDCGMGFFFSAMIIYMFLYSLLISPISDTISKLVSARRAKGFHDNAQKVFYFGVYTSLGLGFLGFIILSLGGNKLISLLYGYTIPSSLLSFWGVIFLTTSINSCLKGYSKGLGYSKYIMIADIARSAVLLISTPLIIRKMYRYGIKVSNLLKNPLYANLDGAIGALIAYLVALIISTIIIIVTIMIVHSPADNDNSVRGMNSKRTFITAYIKTLLSYLNDKFGIVIALLTITIMYLKAGSGYQANTKEIFTTLGVFSGKYLVVLFFPFILFANYVDRERRKIFADYNREEHTNIRTRAGNLLKNTLYIMVPIAVSAIVLAKPLVMIFFAGKMSLGVTLVRKGGIIILLAGISYCCHALLRGVELDFYAAICTVTGYVCLFIFMITSVASGLNVNLLVYAMLIYYLIKAVVSAFLVYRMLDVYIIDIGIKAGKVIAASLGLGIVEGIVDKFFDLNLLTLLALLIVAYLVYFIINGVLQSTTEKELNSLKGTLIYYPTFYIVEFFTKR